MYSCNLNKIFVLKTKKLNKKNKHLINSEKIISFLYMLMLTPANPVYKKSITISHNVSYAVENLTYIIQNKCSSGADTIFHI